MMIRDVSAATREPLILPEVPGAPLACDMTAAGDTADERLAEYARLFAHALCGRERTKDGLELRLTAKPGVADWVVDLARREAACCPFFSYRISFYADLITWHVSSQAGPVAQAILDEFYAGTERFADGMDAMLERLADRGVAISSPATGRYSLDERSPVPSVLGKIKTASGC
jgi:hypothetical protein